MRLKRLRIENFRSIKELQIEFPNSNYLVLVGANNAGKSNVIRAIDMVCGDGWFATDRLEDHDFYMRNRRRELRIRLDFDNGRHAVLSSEERWPQYFSASGAKLYGPQSVKKDFPCSYMAADRTLDKHLAFYDTSLLGRIRRSFHQRATPLKEQLDTKFGELVELFQQVEGFAGFKEDFASFFETLQADMTAKLAIDFRPFTPSNYFKSLFIAATDAASDSSIDLEELGEGSRNSVLLALLWSYAKNFRVGTDGPGLLALEEPEIFLHPQARRHLHNVLRELAQKGHQVIISTHSTSFIDTAEFESIAQVYKVQDDEEDDGRYQTAHVLVTAKALLGHCVKTGASSTKVTEQSLAEYYRTVSNPKLAEGFFAKFIVLVEGETEEMALPIYLRTLGIDCDARGVSVLSVCGKNQLPKYWRLFSLYRAPVVVVFDNDDSAQKQHSNKNIAACFNVESETFLNVPGSCVATESQTEPRTTIVVLNQDFETSVQMDAASVTGVADAYKEADRQARDLIRPLPGQAKGQIARFVAESLAQSHPDFAPEVARKLAVQINEALRLGLKESDLSVQVPF